MKQKTQLFRRSHNSAGFHAFLRNMFTGLLLLATNVIPASAQDTAQIGVRFRIQKNTVLLRWATSTPAAWMQMNKHGVNIVRYTVVRDSIALPQPEMKTLTQIPLKARPLNEWESIVQSDDYAAIIAQALYGEGFDISGGDEKSTLKIISMAQELEQRFAFSLYAADQNFEAACMAGWGWRDTDVRQNERYLYRIIPALPENTAPHLEMGVAFVAMDEYDPLPEPIELIAAFEDKSVMLVWDYSTFSDVYNSYYIEKSADGKNFKRLEGIPVTNLNSHEDKKLQRMYFMDSLTDNSSIYHYRVIGITPFGETGPPSKSVSGHGRELLPYMPPSINRAVTNDSGDLELEWEFEQEGEKFIKGFELNHSNNSEKGYAAIMKDIKPDRRSLTLEKDRLQSSNYFTVTAIPHEGEPRKSFPVLVQPADSIPPAIPAGLQGKIDSAGIVTLSWNKNSEIDLLGYKVLRTFLKDDEVIPLFDIALKDTVYKDTVDVRNLNRKVYYTISAVDLRYNQSDLAPLLELEKPDILPPSSPVISGYKVRKEGIEIQWINSPDEGVIQHRVWRRVKGNGYEPVNLLKSITDSAVKSYVDTSAMTGVHYIYSVTAMKKNGLESTSSNGLTAFTNHPKQQTMDLERFNAIVDKQNKMLKLTWSDKLQNVNYYELYKGADNENISLWKTVQGDKREIIDDNLVLNTTYRYIIRAILKDGKNSKSKSLTIKY
jgi:fibronectin type 3 domain-containing protein